MLVLLLLATLAAGTLIGSIGIGGVLLTPALTYLAGFDVHVAMGTAMWAFVFTGITGTAAYARRGTLEWGLALRLCVGAIPGALAGAWANALLSQGILKLLLAILLVATGSYAIAGARTTRNATILSGPTLAIVGVGVGFGSGLTGTGGPVFAVPTLLLLGMPALPVVGISQVMQLPVSGFGTLGFLLSGRVDIGLGIALGLLASVGVVVGARIAHSVSAPALRRIVAAAVIATGIAIAVTEAAFFVGAS